MTAKEKRDAKATIRRKCSKCRMQEYAEKREHEGKSAADVYRERYPQKASG